MFLKPEELKPRDLKHESQADRPPIPERPESTEADLEKLVHQADTHVSNEGARILQGADQRIEKIPASIGLDQQKASSIYTSGGFAKTIKSLKDHIIQLGQETKSKILSLRGQIEAEPRTNKTETVLKLEELPEEKALLANVESSKQLTHRAQLVTLENGVKAIFKSEFDASKRMPQRERAAYLVDRILKFDLVPATIIRELDGTVGSFQEYVEDGKEIAVQNSETLKDLEFVKMFVFDYLTGIRDRNYESGRNFLITPKGPKAIDNELTFDTSTTNLNFLDKELPAEIVNAILNISEAEVKLLENELLNLLPQDEALKCVQRIRSLSASIKKFGNTIPVTEAGFLRRGY